MCTSKRDDNLPDHPRRKRAWTVPPSYLAVIAGLLGLGAFALFIGAPVLGVALLISSAGAVVLSILYLAATGKLPAGAAAAATLPKQGAAPMLESISPIAEAEKAGSAATEPDSPPEHQCEHGTP